jgi:hypothetical protein
MASFVHTMECQGAYLYHTGGGCTAYRIDLFQCGDSYALITDGECEAPTDYTSELCIVFFNGHGDVIDIDGECEDGCAYWPSTVEGLIDLIERFNRNN